MKKIIRSRLFMITLMLFCILILSNHQVCALTEMWSGVEGFESAKDKYLVNGTHSDMEINSKDLKEASNKVYNILLILGVTAAVIIGMILGIKFMTGGIEEQAKVKESLIPYIAGCIAVFGAFTIWKVVLEVLKTTT